MIALPKWLENMPPGKQKDDLANRFYIRLAALYASEGGRLYKLVELIDESYGVSYAALKSQAIAKARLPETTREGIRKLLGEDFTLPDLTLRSE